MTGPIPFRQLAVLRIGPVLSDEQQGLTYQVGRQGVKAIAYLPDEHGFEVEGEEREGYWIPVANVVWGRKLKAAPVAPTEPAPRPTVTDALTDKFFPPQMTEQVGSPRKRKGRAA